MRSPAAPNSAPPVRLLLAVALLFCLVLGGVGARAASAAGAPAADGAPSVPAASSPGAQPLPGSRVAVVVDRLEPAAPQPADDLEVSGTVVNRAAERFDAAEISLHRGAAIPSRAALRALRTDYPAQPLATKPVRLGTGVLEPGGLVPFTLKVPVAELMTAGPGVFPLQVTVVGRTSEGLRDLGAADTFLPYLPSDAAAGAAAPAPLSVAWFLPLTDPPRLSATGGLLDDSLASSLSDGGSLSDALTAATALPAGTVVVDPALLRAVARMSSGPYPVGVAGGGPVRPVDPEARVWLARLTGAVGPGGRLDLIGQPFADADLEALLHAGRTDLAGRAVASGTRTVRDVLGATPASVAVPAQGRLDRAGADFLAAAGARDVLLAPDAVDTAGRLHVPSGATVAAGTAGSPGARSLGAVVPDPELRRLLTDGPTAQPSPRLSEQSVLAELAQAYLTPDSAGPLVLAPGTDWSPADDWASHVADLTARYPWLRPIGLPDLLAARASGTTTPVELRYTPADAAAETDPGRIAAAGDVLASADGFAGALPRGQQVTRPATETALSALSASLRTDPIGAEQRLDSARQGIGAVRGSVRAVASREITLTSRNGRIPVTLENNLTEPVDVTLQLTSLDRSRVQSDTSVSRNIRPGQKVQVEVAVRATSAGTFPIRLALLTPQGTPVAPPEQVLVRSTAAGVVAKGVTVAALAVLLLAVIGRGVRSLLRRRRRSRSGPPPGGPPSRTGTPESTPRVPA